MNVQKYQYRNNIFEKFSIEAIQFLSDYESISNCISFIYNKLTLDDAFDDLSEYAKFALIGKTLKAEQIIFRNTESEKPMIVKFEDYIIKFNNGSYGVMDRVTFNNTFELCENNDIFHSEWINADNIGQLYKEYNILDNLFIVTNDNNDRFIVYTISKELGRYSISKVDNFVLLSFLEGYVDSNKIFLYPKDNEAYAMIYNQSIRKFTCTKIDSFAYPKPSTTYLKMNDLSMNSYKFKIMNDIKNNK